MPIPDFKTILSPLLAFTGDNNGHSLRDTAENLAVYFKLTPAEKQEFLLSVHTAVFDKRAGWSKMQLLMACLLESPRRAILKILTYNPYQPS